MSVHGLQQKRMGTKNLYHYQEIGLLKFGLVQFSDYFAWTANLNLQSDQFKL
jgi:hypothetical protein